MLLNRVFSGNALRWAIVKTEAFAIVEACKQADYLLRCDGGFVLCTDHRNLRAVHSRQVHGGQVPAMGVVVDGPLVNDSRQHRGLAELRSRCNSSMTDLSDPQSADGALADALPRVT
ncbi:hypothetical protein PsorP6_013622 [Peronosclerospora sorghi]|uniref:Uncharacterized protein n=1 Tax=Peronosclerospora sorghi TaxID=230839 RepID=A0ACC0VJB0_9STRA|nr:hypothetical protein PsorP6_013622 [Peronosclerospora sorghi]